MNVKYLKSFKVRFVLLGLNSSATARSYKDDEIMMMKYQIYCQALNLRISN